MDILLFRVNMSPYIPLWWLATIRVVHIDHNTSYVVLLSLNSHISLRQRSVNAVFGLHVDAKRNQVQTSDACTNSEQTIFFGHESTEKHDGSSAERRRQVGMGWQMRESLQEHEICAVLVMSQFAETKEMQF